VPRLKNPGPTGYVAAPRRARQGSLRYDAACTGTPQKIRAGEPRAAATYNGKDGYLRVAGSACHEEPAFVFAGK
jgi:hypothetical protein